jgi:hypothetical protein
MRGAAHNPTQLLTQCAVRSALRPAVEVCISATYSSFSKMSANSASDHYNQRCSDITNMLLDFCVTQSVQRNSEPISWHATAVPRRD